MSMEAAIARDQGHYNAMLEVEPGLPEPLPPGEKVLWQGAPDWKLLAVHVFHVRPLVAMSMLFAVLSVVVAMAHGAPAPYLALAFVVPLMAGAAAIGVAALSAWLVARVSRYTLTDARLVLRVGLLVPVNLNIPLGEIVDVAMRPHPDGSGDLPLSVRSYKRMSYMLLWPHVRPMRFARVQPMLRAVKDGEKAGDMLVSALRRAHSRREEPMAASSFMMAAE